MYSDTGISENTQELKQSSLEVAPIALAQHLDKEYVRRCLISFARDRQQCIHSLCGDCTSDKIARQSRRCDIGLTVTG